MRTEKIGQYATTQSISEIGLGSAIHSLHIPLGGHFLSLNQCFLLTLAMKDDVRRIEGVRTVLGVSVTASLLKGLSPAGKRITPMVAIAVQGFLYAIGITLLGTNISGALLGSVLLSFWGIIQPLILAWIFFGETFFHAVQTAWSEVALKVGVDPALGLRALIVLVLIKVLLGVVLVILAWSMKKETEENYVKWTESLRSRFVYNKRGTSNSPYLGALFDLLNPLFLISAIMSAVFLFFQIQSGNGDGLGTLWIYALRIGTAGYLFFLLIRIFPLRWIERVFVRFPVIKMVYDRVFGEVVRPR